MHATTPDIVLDWKSVISTQKTFYCCYIQVYSSLLQKAPNIKAFCLILIFNFNAVWTFSECSLLFHLKMNLTHLPTEEKQSKNKQLNKSYSNIFYVINEKHH